MVTLATLVVLTALAVALPGPRMAAIGRAVTAETGPLSLTLQQLLHHRLLWVAIQTRVALALGIVFLMTVKPDLIGSLLTIGVATALGLAAALPVLGRERQEPAT
jgi:hypothetical protein